MTALLSSVGLFAAEHYARLEPLERTTLKAAAAGEIVAADLKAEGRMLSDAVPVRIDDTLDREDLNRSLRSVKLLEETLKITRRTLPGLEESYRRKKRYQEKMQTLTTASQTQKDNAYYGMVSAQNQLLATREKEIGLERQILDLRQKIATLRDRIAKKNPKVRNRYLYKLLVRKGEYASPGLPLAILDDLSRGKLVIYLSPEEIRELPQKSIWIDGKKRNLRFAKIWKETDEKYLSSYRAEIHLKPEAPFGSLHKVEIK
ncbi:hypothetical protein [Nitratifractor sp.]